MESVEQKIHEIVVIGGGLMGSSSAWHLSNYGKQVLLLEKQDEIYDSGSSYGQARIVRSSNIENDELWSYLHNNSVSEIKLLLNFLREQGLDMQMSDIYTTSPVSYLAKIEELPQLLKNLKKQDVNFEVASTVDEGILKFGVNLKKGTFLQREYNLHSGTVNPHELIQSLHKAIVFKGSQISYSTSVKKIEREDDYYSITIIAPDGSSKTINAKQIISAAGPYTGILLKNLAPYFQKLIHPKRVFLTFIKIKNSYYHTLSAKQKEQLKNGYPAIDRAVNYNTDKFYAMIEKYESDGNPIIKIGGHFQRSDIENLDEVWRIKLSSEEINWAIEKTVSYLKFLNLPINISHLEVVDEYSCVYSLTENEVPFVTPIIDTKDSKDKNLVVMAGMSGIGAKGAMSYGQIAANLLINTKPDYAFYETAIAKLGYERLWNEMGK